MERCYHHVNNIEDEAIRSDHTIYIILDIQNSPMAVQLCDQEQMDVFKIIKICFKDVQHFDFRISKELQQYLAEVRLDEIMVKSKKGHTQKYFDMMFYNSTADTRAVFKYIDLAFKCANVLILLLKGTFQSLLWNNVSQLLLAYPEFQTHRSRCFS